MDVDPTQGKWVENDHVVTALGRDYADVSPNRGVYRGRAEESMTVSVKVQAVERVAPDWAEPPAQPSWSAAAQVPHHVQTQGLNHQASGRRRIRQQQQ